MIDVVENGLMFAPDGGQYGFRKKSGPPLEAVSRYFSEPFEGLGFNGPC